MNNQSYSLLAWNINGYSNKIHKWLTSYVAREQPSMVLLTETKRSQKKMDKWLSDFTGYKWILNIHNPTHHHGVAMIYKDDIQFRRMDADWNIPLRADNKGTNGTDGRIICGVVDDTFALVGTYVPNSGYGRSQQNYEYRIRQWDPILQDYLNKLDKMYPTIWMGDVNVAPESIDVCDVELCKQWPGFVQEERDSFARFMERGDWVDIWRMQHPDTQQYTWIGSDPEKRSQHDYGLRLDNTIVSKRLVPTIQESYMVADCLLSDHIPIGIVINIEK